MKQYEIYMQCTSPIRLEAEKQISYITDDRPDKIIFLIGNEIVAEFCIEHIVGWRELKEDE